MRQIAIVDCNAISNRRIKRFSCNAAVNCSCRQITRKFGVPRFDFRLQTAFPVCRLIKTRSVVNELITLRARSEYEPQFLRVETTATDALHARTKPAAGIPVLTCTHNSPIMPDCVSHSPIDRLVLEIFLTDVAENIVLNDPLIFNL